MAFPKRSKALEISKEVQGTDSQLWFMAPNRVAWIDLAKISRNVLAPSVSMRALRAYGRQDAC